MRMKNQIKEIELLSDAMGRILEAQALALSRDKDSADRLYEIYKIIFQYMNDNFTGEL